MVIMNTKKYSLLKDQIQMILVSLKFKGVLFVLSIFNYLLVTIFLIVSSGSLGFLS